MLLGLFGVSLLGGIYSYAGERFWYEVREIQLKVRNLPKVFEGWKIVQFSDIHLGFFYDTRDLKRVCQTINDLKPDIIFFTGDLIEVGYPNPEIAIPLLKGLKADRGGKWAILGNHDYNPEEKVVSTLEQSDFILLRNSHGHIERDGERLYIAGIEDVLNGVADIEKALIGLSNNECTLLLSHEPDFADVSCTKQVAAQFSGHSHGGQVRLPFLGPVIHHEMSVKYVEGLYHVGENKMPLYTNRGVGTSTLPVRLFCRPEITIFSFKS